MAVRHIRAASPLLVIAALFIISCTSANQQSRPSSPIITIPASFSPTYTPSPTIVDKGLAYGDPCKPPCWQGLIPGKSTRQEVAQRLDELLGNGQADHVVSHSGFTFCPTASDEAGAVYLTFQDDTLEAIWGRASFNYSVEDMIGMFGPPEGIAPYPLGTSQGQCLDCSGWLPPPELYPYLQMDILYPGQGLTFQVLVPGNALGCICPNMNVHLFAFYAPRSMPEALHNPGDVFISRSGGVSEKDVSEWHGYGGGY